MVEYMYSQFCMVHSELQSMPGWHGHVSTVRSGSGGGDEWGWRLWGQVRGVLFLLCSMDRDGLECGDSSAVESGLCINGHCPSRVKGLSPSSS